MARAGAGGVVVAIVKYGKGESALPSTAIEMTRDFTRCYSTRYRFIAPNIHMNGGYEMDVMGVRKSGFVDEVEIKVSRSDFLADFKKSVTVRDGEYKHEFSGRMFPKIIQMPKHDAVAAGKTLANYFAFFMPPDLAEQCEADIPDHAGLYIYRPDMWGGKVSEVKRPPRLHNRKISEKAEFKHMEKICWRYRAIIAEWDKAVTYEYGQESA